MTTQPRTDMDVTITHDWQAMEDRAAHLLRSTARRGDGVVACLDATAAGPLSNARRREIEAESEATIRAFLAPRVFAVDVPVESETTPAAPAKAKGKRTP